MKSTFHLDDKVYADLLKMLNALHLKGSLVIFLLKKIHG